MTHISWDSWNADKSKMSYALAFIIMMSRFAWANELSPADHLVRAVCETAGALSPHPFIRYSTSEGLPFQPYMGTLLKKSEIPSGIASHVPEGASVYLLGSGADGRVYRVVLADHSSFSLKLFNRPRDKETFLRYSEFLKPIAESSTGFVFLEYEDLGGTLVRQTDRYGVTLHSLLGANKESPIYSEYLKKLESFKNSIIDRYGNEYIIHFVDKNWIQLFPKGSDRQDAPAFSFFFHRENVLLDPLTGEMIVLDFH